MFGSIDFFSHARSTAFPQVAILATAYAAVWWFWMTSLLLVLVAITWRTQRENDASVPAGKRILLMVGAPPFAVLLLYSFFVLPGDPGFAKRLTTASRGGYAFMGTGTVTFASVLVAFWPTLFFNLFGSTVGKAEQ
jgi:hypothetical protein